MVVPFLRPREGTGYDLSGPRVLYQAPTAEGDSGGPLLAADGSALGIHSGSRQSTEETLANVSASRLSVQLPLAEVAWDSSWS